MKLKNNRGFLAEEIQKLKLRMKEEGKNYVVDDEEEGSDEYVHFFFVGPYEGDEVIYDAALYTLRLQHESELFDIAEHRAAQHFPQYKKITYDEDENGNLEKLDDLEEEIGLFMAEVIMELEEEQEVKVKEHLEIDSHLDFGVGLDVCLNVETITPDVLDRFVREFNKGTFKLDETLYSFQTQDSQEAHPV